MKWGGGQEEISNDVWTSWFLICSNSGAFIGSVHLFKWL